MPKSMVVVVGSLSFPVLKIPEVTDPYVGPVAWDVRLPAASYLLHRTFHEIGLPQGASRLQKDLTFA